MKNRDVNITKILQSGVVFLGVTFIFTHAAVGEIFSSKYIKPQDNSFFISQSVPQGIEPSKTYIVSVTFENVGKTTWKPGMYYLASQNPPNNNTWSISKVNLSSYESIKPGQTKTFTFKISSPSQGGNYNFQWQMFNLKKGFFGAKSENLVIKVNSPPILEPIADISTYEHKMIEFQLKASDPDGDTLTYSGSNLPSGADFDTSQGIFTWNPQHGQSGLYQNIHFEVSDGAITVPEDITVTVIKTIVFGTIYTLDSSGHAIPLEGVSVDILALDRTTVIASGITDATGHFDIFYETWSDGTYYIRASKPGYRTYFGMATLRDGYMMPFSITMVENVPPIVVITSPTDNYLTKQQSITVDGNVSEACSQILVNGIVATSNGNAFHADLTLTEGRNDITAVAYDLAGNEGRSQTIQVIYERRLFKSSPSEEEVWRINCGALFDYIDLQGNLWVKDEQFFDLSRWGFTGDYSYPASTQSDIANTDSDDIFQTNRWGNMAYKLEVPNGSYRVSLLFAETYWNEPGRRVFDISLEGQTMWQNVDVYSLAGGKNIAVVLTSDATVTDGSLDITFPAVYQDYPLISGIEVKVLDVLDDAFLDFLEKKMFWYFWNERNPVTGLVKDKENNFGPGQESVSSIAVTGFALSIYTIGAQRGWVSEYDAYQRTMKILDTFDTVLENLHGFWYHFVDMSSGERAWDSEVSTVDSAIFIMAALQAGEYFKASHPDVAAKADSLYRRMEWGWFTGVGDWWQERFINMGWKPENDGYSFIIPSNKPEGGYYCNDWWNRYSESIFVDLLAIGSPTYPVDTRPWTDMTRNWADAFGYHWINEPPLFVHQYHHLYFNLADIRDDFTDYFLNSQKATLANRETSLTDSRYEPKRWGLTACFGPDGYYHAYGGMPGGYNDGTVAPSAAATSIMFTPAESIEAVRYMYFQYKHHIWGRHGLCNSFNVEMDFRHWSSTGLDNGAMLIGIENYRTQMVRDTFMDNPYAHVGLAITGFKETPQVTESSYESEELKGRMAFDGNLTTRWSSLFADTPQWLEIDFKTERTFNKVVLNWEAAYAKSYKIQVSNNRINWTDTYSTTEGDGGIDEITFTPPISARYVRMYGLERATPWGYSLWEIAISSE